MSCSITGEFSATGGNQLSTRRRGVVNAGPSSRIVNLRALVGGFRGAFLFFSSSPDHPLSSFVRKRQENRDKKTRRKKRSLRVYASLREGNECSQHVWKFYLVVNFNHPLSPSSSPSFLALLYYGLFDARLYSLRNPIALFI